MRVLGLSVAFFLAAFHSVPAAHAADRAAPMTALPPAAFEGGFALLESTLGPVMGKPLVAPRVTGAGDVMQETTTGLAYWLRSDNVPVFFDGVTRHGLTDRGLVEWTGGDISPPPMPRSPTEYLYQMYPDLAPRMACVIERESGWNAAATNARSGAAGLAQFMPSTWSRMVPAEVRQGRSSYDPYAAIDGAAWLAQNYGYSQWEVVLRGMC